MDFLLHRKTFVPYFSVERADIICCQRAPLIQDISLELKREAWKALIHWRSVRSVGENEKKKLGESGKLMRGWQRHSGMPFDKKKNAIRNFHGAKLNALYSAIILLYAAFYRQILVKMWHLYGSRTSLPIQKYVGNSNFAWNMEIYVHICPENQIP